MYGLYSGNCHKTTEGRIHIFPVGEQILQARGRWNLFLSCAYIFYEMKNRCKELLKVAGWHDSVEDRQSLCVVGIKREGLLIISVSNRMAHIISLLNLTFLFWRVSCWVVLSCNVWHCWFTLLWRTERGKEVQKYFCTSAVLSLKGQFHWNELVNCHSVIKVRRYKYVLQHEFIASGPDFILYVTDLWV